MLLRLLRVYVRLLRLRHRHQLLRLILRLQARAHFLRSKIWTRRPLLLSETGLPNCFYIPSADVRQDLLEESDTHTVCPYKGTASYWTVSAGGRKLADAVWSYPQAEGDSAAVSGYLSFLHDELTIEVGQPG